MQFVDIAPNEGYVLSDVIIDETTSVMDQIVTSENGSATYMLSNVTGSHTITAKFSKQSKFRITTISNEGITVTGIYENHKCASCGGYDHECEIVNMFITTENVVVTEQ